MGLGLIAFVLSPTGSGGSTNGGISKDAPQLILVNVPGPSDPDEDTAPAMLVKGDIPGSVKIVGATKVGGLWLPDDKPGLHGPMFGGNFAYTPEPQFGEAIEGLLGHKFYGAVAIHDRWEDEELHATMGR